ncbi:MAG: hypothetical protein R3B93_26945 [Bacteroidia bacterium]
MKRIVGNLLKITLFLDFLITFGFGLASWFFPQQNFWNHQHLIPQTNEPLFLTILSSLSIFYVLTSLVCFIGIKASFPVNIWIAGIMIIRHLWIRCVNDGNQGYEPGLDYWKSLSGYNHSFRFFVLVYIVACFYLIRSKE